MAKAIEARAGHTGLVLSRQLIEELAEYLEILSKWNQRVSLTALRVNEQNDEAIDRLIVEPLLAAPLLPQSGLLIDVGTGGGSPAIPLKLARPTLELVMVESRGRKAAFLREVIRVLGLKLASVREGRLESIALDPDLQGFATAVTVRAVKVTEHLEHAVSTLLAPSGQLFVFSASSDTPSAFDLARLKLQESTPLLRQRSRLDVYRAE